MGSMNIRTQPSADGPKYPHARKWGAPGGSYETSAGDWIYAPGGDMNKIAELVEIPELATDPRFTPAELKPHIPELYAILKEAYLKHDAAYWVERAKICDLPLVRMLHFQDVPNDEQCIVNGYVETVAFRDGSTNVMPTSPFEMASFTPPPTVPAPLVGADTEEVLKTLGYDDAAINAMLESGAAKK
jgi:formyl-CoA transferase